MSVDALPVVPVSKCRSVVHNILQCLSSFHLVFVQLGISLLCFLAKRVQVFRSVQLLYTCVTMQSKQYIYKLGNGLLWIKYGSPFPSLYTALFYYVMSSAVKLGHSTLDQHHTHFLEQVVQ